MISRRLCPDCGGDLGRSATKCRCGWKAQSDSAPTGTEVTERAEAFRKAETERQSQADHAAWLAAGSPTPERSLAAAKGVLRSITSTGIDAGAHWRKVLANPNACYAAKEMAMAALAKIEGVSMDREAGQDDEERVTT